MTVVTVASIGSPWLRRVVGLTATRSASFMDNSCFYGLVSSSAEAVQMIAHGLGVRELPDMLAPLLSGQEGFTNEPVLELSHDRVFVEISTRRVYTLDGVHVSPNLLRRFFAGNPSLTDAVLRHWGDTEARRAHIAALADDPEMRGVTDDEVWILNNIGVSVQDDDQVTLDLRRLHAMLGDRMVIVAAAPQRNVSEPGENRLRHVLHRIAMQLGVPFVDAGQSAAEAWQEFGGSEEAAFNAHFEILFAGELIRKFIEPAREIIARTVDAKSARRVRTRKGSGILRSRQAQPQAHGAPGKPDPRLYAFEAGSAAWVADWPNARKAVQAAMAAGETGAEILRLGFRAAWYLNELQDAFRYFEQRVQEAGLAPAELLDGAEVAFQLAERYAAFRWAMLAVRAAPALAELALRLAQVHGYEDESLPLLEAAAEAGQPVVDIILLLHRDSLVKRRIALDILARWAGEPVASNLENLLILALRFYDPGVDVARARALCRWCENFETAEQARPIVARALVRALNAAFEAAELQGYSAETEQIAMELVELEPANGKAVTYLAQIREAQGRLEEAAQLFEQLGSRSPDSAAVQGKRIIQWLKANDLGRAYHALKEAEPRHRDNRSIMRLRERVLGAIAGRIRDAAPSERANFILMLDPADFPAGVTSPLVS